jgi:hypothetical protein
VEIANGRRQHHDVAGRLEIAEEQLPHKQPNVQEKRRGARM